MLSTPGSPVRRKNKFYFLDLRRAGGRPQRAWVATGLSRIAAWVRKKFGIFFFVVLQNVNVFHGWVERESRERKQGKLN